MMRSEGTEGVELNKEQGICIFVPVEPPGIGIDMVEGAELCPTCALCSRPARRAPLTRCCAEASGPGGAQQELPSSVFPKRGLLLFPDTRHPWACNLLSEVDVNEESHFTWLMCWSD